MNKFAISEALKFGFETFKKNIWFLVGVVVVILFINFIPEIVNSQLRSEEYPFVLAITGIVFWILNMLVSLGGIKVALALVDNKKTEFNDLFNGYPQLINFIISSILYAIIVVIGLIFLIIPGIYLGIRLHFYSYFIVDKKAGPIEALKESARITKGSIWKLFLFTLVAGFLNIGGFVALGVGLLVTIPVTMVAYAYIYRKLLGSSPSPVATK